MSIKYDLSVKLIHHPPCPPYTRFSNIAHQSIVMG